MARPRNQLEGRVSNLFAVNRDRNPRFKIDLGWLEDYPTDQLPDFNQRLTELLPGLCEHGCCYGEPGGFIRRLERGTWLGHVAEHIAMELQCMAGTHVTYGKTRGTGVHGTYNVVYSFLEERVGLRAGYLALRPDRPPGETAAVALATDLTVSGGSDGVLVIPADVPLITAAEVKAILDAAPESGTVLVPAADGRGTNAILRRPANLFSARFGNDSFLPHLENARRSGRQVVILELPGVALDVDRPDDLAALLAAGGSTRTQNLLRSWQAVETAHSSPCR